MCIYMNWWTALQANPVYLYYKLKCKDLVYFFVRKLTFGLLSDNAAVHLLQDDSKLGPLACLSPHHPG